MSYQLVIKLLSDTTFASGDSVAGYVDTEVEYDHTLGLPIIKGRTLKGLLVEECANLHHAIGTNNKFEDVARHLFGQPGTSADSAGSLRIGNAKVSGVSEEEIRAFKNPQQVLQWFTTTRGQTSITEEGVPEKGSLRISRVVLRETEFRAEVELMPTGQETRDTLKLLAACAMSVLRGGQGRNRGRGRLKVTLEGAGVPDAAIVGKWLLSLREGKA